MIKKIFLLVLVSFSFASLKATHNRAGEITYRQLSDLTYEITITTFTYTLSLADRPNSMWNGEIILFPGQIEYPQFNSA